MSDILAAYSALLGRKPLATKSVTSAVLAVAGDLVVKHLTKATPNARSTFAFLVYGAAVSGPVPHYFYNLLDKLVPPSAPNAMLKRLAIDRLAFAPLMTALFFATTRLLQGESVKSLAAFLRKALVPAVQKNWLWWTPAMCVAGAPP